MALTCALGSSVLLMAACGTDATHSSVAEAAPTSPTAMSPTAASPASPTPASPTPSLNEDQAHRRDLITKTHVSWEKAAATAVKEVPGGKLVDLDLKTASGGATASPGTASPGTAGPGTPSPGTPSPGTGSPSPSPSAGAPEWEAKVAAADGTVHRVDIDAVSGTVSRSRTEPNQDADDKREVADRLHKATQTSAQAVKTATDKTKGTVTGISLDEHDHRLVWSVDVVTTDNWNKTTFDVDAANGKIVREHVDHD
ncbi:lipoprotein [Streptomyces spiralis]|uniref:Lipoprotein n=1 Tax=Streptomyces spiralis TaxID=66376 RepID=A0A919DU71_9ACTN|nr:PepSY domain-containing protein [Streptomyces spiralis]GHE79352.1 lipoprotein [Streptomyces spiralis]